MITLLIGHRGVGKSYVLNRLQQLYSQNDAFGFFDLDEEIESRNSKKISDLFIGKGESWFRDEELACLKSIVDAGCDSTKSIIIATGAGIELDRFDGLAALRVVWLQRPTDSDGRVFLNRPRLNPDLSPIDEYLFRKEIRDSRFKRWSQYAVEIPEGYVNSIGLQNLDWDYALAALILGTETTLRALPTISGFYTIPPSSFGLSTGENRAHCDRLELALSAGFELRTDLLTKAEIENFFRILLEMPALKRRAVLLSVRDQNIDWEWVRGWRAKVPFSVDIACELNAGMRLDDWLIEHTNLVDSFSYHGADEFILEQLALLQHRFPNILLKWSPEVSGWSQLDKGHLWWQEASSKRSFLPRSINGRWRWYRSLTLGLMPQQFVRFADGGYLDQPCYLEFLMLTKNGDKNGDGGNHSWKLERVMSQNRDGGSGLPIRSFAAVLGSPVNHSWSPLFHASACHGLGMFGFFSIDLTKEEWISGIDFLQKVGLRFAAVTSPLKIVAAEYLDKGRDGGSSQLTKVLAARREFSDGINSLAFNLDSTGHLFKIGESTDADGIALQWKQLCSKYQVPLECDGRTIAIWGGGGVLASIAQIFPEAKHFSSKNWSIDKQRFFDSSSQVLIWAGSRHAPIGSPADREQWKKFAQLNNLLIWDLSYRDNSIAREFANQVGCAYENGALMFLGQAKKQQQFFLKNVVCQNLHSG